MDLICYGLYYLIFILVKPDDKFILLEVPYSEVESLLLDPSDQFITLNLVRTDQERQRVYVFETSQKATIGALVAAYRPALANWVRETADASAPVKRRVKQVKFKLFFFFSKKLM